MFINGYYCTFVVAKNTSSANWMINDMTKKKLQGSLMEPFFSISVKELDELV